MSNGAKAVSIVIPVYNEADILGGFLEKLQVACGKLGRDVEIICVDDSSEDGSSGIAGRIAGVRVIRHKMNRGYGASLKTGIRHASNETIVIMDGDGQHDPGDLVSLLAAFEEGCDMVVGERTITKQTISRTLGKKLLNFFAKKLFHGTIKDLNSGYRVFRRSQALRFLHVCSERFSFSTSMTLAFLAENLDITHVPIELHARGGGKSYVNMKAGWQALWRTLIIAMAFHPIRVLLPIVILNGTLTVASVCVDILQRDVGDTTVLLFVSTILLLVFALIAEQLAAIHRDLHERHRSDS